MSVLHKNLLTFFQLYNLDTTTQFGTAKPLPAQIT